MDAEGGPIASARMMSELMLGQVSGPLAMMRPDSELGELKLSSAKGSGEEVVKICTCCGDRNLKQHAQAPERNIYICTPRAWRTAKVSVTCRRALTQ